MTEYFHNPYHFVPVKKSGSHEDLDITLLKKGDLSGHVTHERFWSEIEISGRKKELFSGRIICRLMTESPIFIGDKREELQDDSHRVYPFELNRKPAIPSSTLRGLISSLSEAASNSALRILECRHYSYRVEMRDGLKALGMLVWDTATNTLRLRPLALPALRWRNNEGFIEEKYREMFTQPLLKVYVDGYHPRQTGQSSLLEITPGSFIEQKNPKSYSSDNQEFWYIKLKGTSELKNNKVVCQEPQIKPIKHKQGNLLHFLNGQKAIGTPITQEAYENMPSPSEPNQYVRGILRVLGIECREAQIPTTKVHEIFIPYPKDMENYPTFDVSEALKHFHDLAKERTKFDNDLPFHLKGSRRNSFNKSDKQEIELRDGDIVFFEPDPTDHSKVANVSISSIWRASAGGSSYDYFSQISPELLPFNPDRGTVSVAEQLFGFVESRQEGSSDDTAFAFASRVRFSNGELDEKDGVNEPPYSLEEIPLKILDAPKPPCPSMYFKNNDGSGAYIPKKKLSTENNIPQGRKFYLHKRAGSHEPWRRTPELAREHLKQLSRICPLRDKLTFYFHIDFYNLSRLELSLLSYALEPSDAFRHKIGMGKPIGLGTIQIVPEGLFVVDRSKRYCEDLRSNRYHKSWVKSECSDNWPERYQREKAAAALGDMTDVRSLSREFASSMDEDIKTAIELIGDPTKVVCPVHTPQVERRHLEVETFRWFVENEKKFGDKRQCLEPIVSTTDELQKLRR